MVLRQQADQLQPPRCFQVGELEGTLSDKLFLFGDDPGHVEVIRRLGAVGILPNDDVTFFRPQHVHGLRPVGSQIVRTSKGPKSFPDRAAMTPGYFDLESKLALQSTSPT